MTPITEDTYRQYQFPWYTIYDDHLATLPPNESSFLPQVQSMQELEKRAPITAQPYQIIDKARATCVNHRNRQATCVLRPCGHLICHPCVQAVREAQSCSCRAMVDRFIGFHTPIDSPGEVDESSSTWAEGGNYGVAIFHDPTARVAPLHAKAWLQHRSAPVGGIPF